MAHSQLVSHLLELACNQRFLARSNERSVLRQRSTRVGPFLKITTNRRYRNSVVLNALPSYSNAGFRDDRHDANDSKKSRFTCRALPVADYSFYQRMRKQDVTEAFLWEHRLEPLLGYLPAEEVGKVREALSLAYDAHSGQYRKSGEPFITHPVEVTRILAELQMDYESLVAGLLHDTVEDCGEVVGLEEISFHFGNAVMRIVEGETKFSKLPTHHPERRAMDSSGNGDGSATTTTENGANRTGMAELAAVLGGSNGETSQAAGEAKAQDLQFLFLAMTEEVRIIVVKLADRLHNMRTMASMPPGKQRRIAQETLSVFAPLARLLGLYTIKEELEELSFKYALPQQHAVVSKTVEKLWEQQRPAVEAAAEELTRKLSADPYLQSHLADIRVEPGKRALYGIWRKLQDSGKTVRDIVEISQLRVVMTPAGQPCSNMDYSSDKQLCYHAMGLIHASWAPIPGSMKDYIATPKPNNYQSLHTTVVPTGLTLDHGSNGANGNGRGRYGRTPPTLFPIEIQIRTEEMDKLAEYGIAVESWSCADYSRSSAINERARLDADLYDGSRNGTSSATFRRLPGFNDVPTDDEDGGGGLSDYSDILPSNNGSSSNGNGTSSNGSSSSSSWEDIEKVYESNGNGVHYSENGSKVSARSGSRLDTQTMSRRINWLNSIRQWQQEFVGTLTASEFVECITDDILGQGVFVFTPSGQVMRLPKGATVIDFAYHIHTDIGNTMVAAKVNGKVVAASHELQNAEVVEVITYKGPINATIIKRHQQWLDAAHTKTARHKIAKFLREHAAFAAAKGLLPPEGSSLLLGSAKGSGADGTPQTTWLVIKCADRQGLLAEVSNAIARHQHNITSYSGSSDRDSGAFVMEYELDGDPAKLKQLCDDLSCLDSVESWAIGCTLQDAHLPRKSAR